MMVRQDANSYLIQTEVTIIILSTLLQTSLSIATVCDTIRASQKGQQALNLPYLPDAFHATIETNILDKQSTVSAQLYFDNPGNRAAIITIKNGMENKLIFNYKMDEVYSVTNDACTTIQLSTSNYTSWFGMILSDGNIHINDSQSALHFGKRFNEVYIGPTTIDGVTVDHWKSCPTNLPWKNLTVDYYFSSNWSTPSTIQSEPVRAEVQGYKTLPNGTVYNMHHIYTFSNFIPDVDDVPDTMFQTSSNIVCPGRKQSKGLPKLPDGFYFKTEQIYEDLAAINFEDTWYDKSVKLFRKDHHPIIASYPTYSLNPLTEIHDYNTGVRYLIDKSVGNCTTLALSTNLMDASLNMTAYKYNDSFVLEMKSPIQFFHLDLNYVYMGQLYSRDILCDTYQAVSNNFTLEGFVNNKMVIITLYFLAQDWTNIYDTDTKRSTTSVPVRMELNAPDVGFTLSYNFVDFDPSRPSSDVFDISKCFNEANKLSFQLKFPGTTTPNAEHSIKEWAHLVLAEKMQVSILRISHVSLISDDANIYISATLLDQTNYKAQFTYIQGQTMEFKDDATLLNSTGVDECMSFCVNSPVLPCSSLDYCNNDKTCRLSIRHISDGTVLQNTPSCDHYSRNVDGFPAQTTIIDAYRNLRKCVYGNTLTLTNVGPGTYTAVDVVITFGWMNPDVTKSNMLSAPKAYSYTLETSVPSDRHVYATKVWYDDGFQIMRHDPHFNKIVAPYYTTHPLSIVEDFNTGVKYIIDKTYRNCTMTNIDINDFGVLAPSNTTGSYSLTLRDPLQSFRIDSNYFFVGQQTVRGMTCNIFESLRTDYPTPNGTVNAIFRYAFLADGWMEISDGYLGGSAGQPIQLQVTTLKTASYSVFNFYDYDTDHPDSSLFDVHLCFSANQTKQFQITFPGHYTEFLNTTSKMFIIEAIFMMSNRSGASTLRFQRTRIDHDDKNIYLTSTLISQPDKLQYFTYIRNGYEPARVDQVVPGSQSVAECAAKCFDKTNFKCNSFYLCTGQHQCLLSSQNVLLSSEGQKHERIPGCVAYSRTTDQSTSEPNNDVAFRNLANAVFAGKLRLQIPVPETVTNKIVAAIYIKDVFLSNEQHDPQDFALKTFTVYAPSTTITDGLVRNNLDLNQCAQTCLSDTDTACSGFSYCGGSAGACLLSTTHPDQMDTSELVKNVNCSTYNRNYASEYTKLKGMISQTRSDIPVSAVESDEKCAQTCSGNNACKMFQYCPNTKQCVMYNERQFGPHSNDTTTTCNIYISPFEKDFSATNAGTYQFVSSVALYSVTKADCAKYCIQQQNSYCSGFYFCSRANACYLPGYYGKVTSTMKSGDIFCDQYNRTHFPIPTGRRSPSTGSSTLRPSSSTHSSTKLSSPTTSTASTIVSMSSSSTNVVTTTTRPCPVLQKQNSNKSNNTGTVAGVAVGTFILGLILGAVGLYVFRKIRNLDNDELKTNFVGHEDM